MTGFAPALWAEWLKVRRSRVPWLTALGFSLAPLVGGLFMMIIKDPDWARRFGLITSKAHVITGTADWPAYFGLLVQATAVGGLIVFGVTAIWVFGREYSDRTAKDLLALPVSRGALVGAKFVVVAAWSSALAVMVYALGLGIGAAIGLPGWSTGLAVDAAVQLLATAGLTIALVFPFAWAACAGRGYLPPVGAMFLVLLLSQVLAATGWGAYFPWSVPALSSGVAGPGAQDIGASSYLIVALAGLAGLVGTLAWWRLADQT